MRDGKPTDGLRKNRPYLIPELARKIGFEPYKLRRWLMRAHLAQPEIGGIVKTANGWVVSSIVNLAKYEGWGAVAERFVSTDDATKLQERIKEQDKQIQALRARLNASERTLKQIVAFIEKGTGKSLDGA